MTIVHLSTDFPDSFAPQKTHAIKNLVDSTRDDFDHLVYSLNRIGISPIDAVAASAKGWNSHQIGRDEYGPVWTYDAPDNGLYLRSSLNALAEVIAADLQKQNIRPSIVIGHKLSIEGIIAAHIAKLLDIPYALTLQGNSDRKILNIRRDIRGNYKKIYHNAAMVFPFTPWAFSFCETYLGARKGPVQMLPCISGQEQIIPPRRSNGRLLTAFHLRHRKIKNLPNMLKAVQKLRSDDGTAILDIYGGGDTKDENAVRADIAAHAPGRAQMQGAAAHDKMQAVMNGYAGFTMISRNESFGLVFIEALMAGCPVAYPRNAAIDGYFDGHDFAISVPANNVDAIAEAMARQLADEAQIKSKLLSWQESGGAECFKKTNIAAQFRDGLNLAMGKGIEK